MIQNPYKRVRAAISPASLAAGAIIALLTVAGVTTITETEQITDMRIEPSSQLLTLEETFEIKLIVEAPVAVNVFAGELHFNHNILQVTSIDYNTSIADLWAEKPWYDNGAGTLNFAGGTTKPGGFEGVGSLVTVRFKAINKGEGVVSIQNPRVLLHDGYGTDSHLKDSVNNIFTITDTEHQKPTIDEESATTYKVAETLPSTDLNGDGKQSLADISIFMLNIASNDKRFDFNLDGKVNLGDLSVLLDK